jgi:hypothetical protein
MTFVACTWASLPAFDVAVSTVHSQWFPSNNFSTSNRCTVTLCSSFITANGIVVHVYPHIPVTWLHQTFPVYAVDIKIWGNQFNTIVGIRKLGKVEVNAVTEDAFSAWFQSYDIWTRWYLYLDPWRLLGNLVKYIYAIHRWFYKCSKCIVYYGEFENGFYFGR